MTGLKTKAGRAPADKAAGPAKLRRETASLRRRLKEVEESLDAIRTGKVDALVIKGPHGAQVYTLRDADRTYRTIIEKMREGAVTIRPDGLVLYANRQFADMLGVPLEKLLGENLFAQAEPSGAENLKRFLERALTEGARAEVRFRTASRGRLLAQMSLAPMSLGELQVLSGVVADVTEERRNEDERMRLAAAVAQGVDGVMIMDPSGEVIYANPACLRISGYEADEIIGTGLERYGEELVAEIGAVLAKEGAWKGHLGRLRKDGSQMELDVAVAPVKLPDGAVMNYVVSFRDVTRAMKLEQTIRQMERTEALGRLAGGVAHDLNNILLPIIINAELLLEEADPDTPRHHMLKNILQAAQRQKDLVTRVLAFTRQIKEVFSAVRMRPLVEEAVKLLKPSFPKGIEVRYAAENSRDTVRGDSTELHELVANLCTNAVDAMGVRGGLLEILLKDAAFEGEDPLPGLSPGPKVKLVVRDTGCGIPPGDLERIFDPFFTTKEPGKGTGIGLSVVRGIVKSHGGAITIESKVGQGTEVSVYLPAVEEETLQSDASARDPGPRVEGRQILLVDDEEMVLETLRRALVSFGHKPTAVRNPAGALALFRTEPSHFDLAIIDQTMPQMSGLALAEELRRISPGLPIILATGYNKAVDDRSIREAGVSEVIMKPLSLRELASAIERILGSSAS